MDLAQGPKGKQFKILSYDKAMKHKTMITGIGILPGDIVEVISTSVLGSPLTIELSDGEKVALRVDEAKYINVEEVL